jgi:hypothetical protein
MFWPFFGSATVLATFSINSAHYSPYSGHPVHSLMFAGPVTLLCHNIKLGSMYIRVEVFASHTNKLAYYVKEKFITLIFFCLGPGRK